MKKTLLVFICCLILFSGGCSKKSSGSVYKDGSYTQTVTGYGGEFKITVVLKEDKIQEIQILDNNETKGVGTLAFEYVVEQILDKQTTDVDGVSGATLTSNAIKSAVNSALEEAKIEK